MVVSGRRQRRPLIKIQMEWEMRKVTQSHHNTNHAGYGSAEWVIYLFLWSNNSASAQMIRRPIWFAQLSSQSSFLPPPPSPPPQRQETRRHTAREIHKCGYYMWASCLSCGGVWMINIMQIEFFFIRSFCVDFSNNSFRFDFCRARSGIGDAERARPISIYKYIFLFRK